MGGGGGGGQLSSLQSLTLYYMYLINRGTAATTLVQNMQVGTSQVNLVSLGIRPHKKQMSVFTIVVLSANYFISLSSCNLQKV